MKRLIALILACMFLLTACGAPAETVQSTDPSPSEQKAEAAPETDVVDEPDEAANAEQSAEEGTDPVSNSKCPRHYNKRP